MKIVNIRLICVYCVLLITLGLQSQNRWTNTYLDGEDPFGECVINHYDDGFLLLGRYGPNYPSFNWLIKTDINGEVMWKKVIGTDNNSTFFNQVALDENKNCYISGSTYYYGEDDADPLIIKLNQCGEKEWCRVFSEDGTNYSRSLVVNNDNGITVALAYMYWPPYTNRICLIRLDSEGNLIWKKYYNGQDSLISSPEVESIIRTPDNGYLITGICYYPDPDNPELGWIKPYYIKTDSGGNFLWERVVHQEVASPGGEAWNTVVSSDNNYFYSSISHYYYYPERNAPALLKMDMNGNVINIFDIATPSTYGKLYKAKFTSDSTLMASIVMGGGPPKAVIIDTLGNIIYQTNLLDNEWMANTEVTQDNKLLYLTMLHDDEDNFSTYLFKFNNQLQSDTIYTQIFNYDSLCPYPIVNDTIVPDNCGIIVGNGEIIMEKKERISVFPNPASKSFTVKSVQLESGGILQLINMQGQIALLENIPSGTTNYEVDVSDLMKGIYLVKFKSENGKEVSTKLIVN